MEPRIHVITLGVDDLERALAFYRDGLGFASPGVIGTEFPDDTTGAAAAVVVFDLRGGPILALYPRADLARDAGVASGPPKTGEFSVGHVVAGPAEVRAVLDRARAAGATILDEPRARPWGIYSGYFQDLDGHLWEVLHNPALAPDPEPATAGHRKRFAPIFPVRDLDRALAHYRRLGFRTRAYEGGGYGFAVLDGVEVHLGAVPGPATPASAYLFVDDADGLARTWAAAGADVRAPEDTAWGQREGVVIDPDGNVIRFGSPMPRPSAGPSGPA